MIQFQIQYSNYRWSGRFKKKCGGSSKLCALCESVARKTANQPNLKIAFLPNPSAKIFKFPLFVAFPSFRVPAAAVASQEQKKRQTNPI